MSTKQQDAELILKLYELRRDETFRKARAWYSTEFNPTSASDIVKLMIGGVSVQRKLSNGHDLLGYGRVTGQ